MFDKTTEHSWVLTCEEFCSKTQLHTAPIYTVGNGLFACRGFMEEQQDGIAGLGGIYMAGVFGHAEYKPWRGEGRELVNIPNFFSLRITINGRPLIISEEHLASFRMELLMQEGILRRSYLYKEEGVPVAAFTFERFAGWHEIHTAGQSVTVTPLKPDLDIQVELDTRTSLTNLNLVSCEPYPIQPGRRQYDEDVHTPEMVSVTIPRPDQIRMAFAQRVSASGASLEANSTCHCCHIKNNPNETAVIEKLISVSVSLEDGSDVENAAAARLQNLASYPEERSKHREALGTFWDTSDIEIQGSPEDQLTIRYNILQLAQSCPSHTSHSSIGARGLTGEMYEGSVFWDTEIFMLPFFSLVQPDSAKKLLEFRYHTLPEARIHAKNNWFEGAMYGWQVNGMGVEQTPQGVGAYYSIHVIADIAFAILDYLNCTGDIDFMLEEGLEILIETARFWASRVSLDEHGCYQILAVRGPNEYDVLVNNNLYTNMMARENFILCRQLLTQFSQSHKEHLTALTARLHLTENEVNRWKEIEDHILLPYDQKQRLWLEDDTYLRRTPLDMKKAKPTAKRIIDTTIPYEALPFYQVSKQADVLHLMKNLPWYFTEEEIRTAYDFYQPKTAFDSSLSYSMFALMAARLGNMEEAVYYYEKSSQLDIKNVQLNTISGLHFANFGGTWQALVFGFGGIQIHKNHVEINPHLPKKWKQITFLLNLKGRPVRFTIRHDQIQIESLSDGHSPVTIQMKDRQYQLQSGEVLCLPVTSEEEYHEEV